MCKTICTQLCLLLVLLSCSLFLIMHMYWWLEIAQWLREHVLLCRGPSLDSHTHVRWLVNCLQLHGVLMPLTFTGTCIHMYTHISVKKLCVHCVCACECNYFWRPREAVGSCAIGILGSWSHHVGAGTKPGSSRKATQSVSH